MSVLSKGNLTTDYTDDGEGPPAVLIHSSALINPIVRQFLDAEAG